MSRLALMGAICLIIVGVVALTGESGAGQEDLAEMKAYRLVVGDRIQIVVHSGRGEEERTYDVPADGHVSFPPLGRVPLAGRTRTEIEQFISDGLRKTGRLTDPRVFIIVMEYMPRKAFLFGAVTSDIDLPVHKSYSLIQVLSMAGASPESADLRNIKIVRTGKDGRSFSIPVNVQDFFARDDFKKDLRVMPDDIIHIPSYHSVEKTQSVYILGNVSSPGQYSFVVGRTEMTLTKLLARAGGFSQFADEGEIRILRKQGLKTVVDKYDFDDIIDNKVADPVLRADDLVFVDESPI